MDAVVIYDNKGNIWNTTYGDCVLPEKVNSIRFDVPEGKQLSGVDNTDPQNPQPIFTDLPGEEILILKAQVESLKNINDALNDELTNTQLALVDFYEEMSCKDLNEGGDV